MYEDENVKEVEVWSWEWVDAVTGNVWQGSLSGTPWKPFPNVIQRYIMIGTKTVHKGCGGVLEPKHRTCWDHAVSYTRRWKECSVCAQQFFVEGDF